MYFNKTRKITSPYWLFLIKLASDLDRNINAIHNLQIISEIWNDQY